MNRVAVFVDAGYLFAQGSALLTGQKKQRGEVTLDVAAVLTALTEHAERVSGVPLLRVYWYDGTSSGPTAQHTAIAHMAGVKVRLGFVNRSGEQKGVDSLIITDMISLARNRAMADAVLLSGDEDLRVGVQQAQEFGVRVHLLGIKPSRGSQSLFLLQEADSTHEWDASVVSSILEHTPRASEPKTSRSSEEVYAIAAAAPAAYEAVASEVAATVGVASLEALIAAYGSTAQVPREYDSRLLARARVAIGRDLEPKEKKDLRARFIAHCEMRRLPTLGADTR
jgi:uncharacterized LabA/DUF88 family protein